MNLFHLKREWMAFLRHHLLQGITILLHNKQNKLMKINSSKRTIFILLSFKMQTIVYKLKELAVGTDDKPIVQSHENKI